MTYAPVVGFSIVFSTNDRNREYWSKRWVWGYTLVSLRQVKTSPLLITASGYVEEDQLSWPYFLWVCDQISGFMLKIQ